MKNKKNTKFIVLNLIVAAILILMICLKIRIDLKIKSVEDNQIQYTRYEEYEDPTEFKETEKLVLEADLDGDLKKENIEVVVYSWLSAVSNDYIVGFNSYSISIDGNKMIEMDPKGIEAAISRENIYLKDYDEDGIDELCISMPVRSFEQYEWIYKYQNKQLVLLDINFIDKDDEIINRIKKTINNNGHGAIYFNSKNIFLIGLIGLNQDGETELYLYDSDKNIARIIGRKWITTKFSPSDNPKIAFTKIENFISHNRDLMPIYFDGIVENIDYELVSNESWESRAIITKYNEDKYIDRIFLHLDKDTNTGLLIFKFKNSNEYSFNYIPYFWGEKILNSVN